MQLTDGLDTGDLTRGLINKYKRALDDRVGSEDSMLRAALSIDVIADPQLYPAQDAEHELRSSKYLSASYSTSALLITFQCLGLSLRRWPYVTEESAMTTPQLISVSFLIL